jgi:hypothetical protein
VTPFNSSTIFDCSESELISRYTDDCWSEHSIANAPTASVLVEHLPERLPTIGNLGNRFMFTWIKSLADRFKWSCLFALQQREHLALNCDDPFDPRLFRKVFWQHGYCAVEVVNYANDLQQETLGGKAGLALALFSDATAEVHKVGRGALMGGTLLIALKRRSCQGGGEVALSLWCAIGGEVPLVRFHML